MGKSITSVFSPHKFAPSILKQDMDIVDLWQINSPFIFSTMAHIAYFNEVKIKTYMEILGADKTVCYDHDGAQAFLSIWDNKAVLVFRGTEPIEGSGKHHHKLGFFHKLRIKHLMHLPLDPLSLIFLNNDILADLKFIPTNFDDHEEVNVHRGFLGELDKLWNNTNILQDIDEYVKDLPLSVTGHSLGGAMATLAGMRYCFEHVVTFGEPRVGNNIEKAFKSKKHTRYVNGDDPVTKLPPEVLFDYQHHGSPVNISDANGETDFKYDHSIIYYSENLSV